MKQHHVTCEIQARYFLDEPTQTPAKTTWMLLHGYGQLAQDFQVNFEPCLSSGIRCIYPEGLSSFYSSMKHGQVGASWMTKEDRLVAISNAQNYLKKVVEDSYSPELLLGFSQGAEMASRLSVVLNTKTLVLWGGKLAPEVLEGEKLERMRKMKIYSLQGHHDHIYTQERHERDRQSYAELGLQLEVIDFEGGHEINQDALHELCERVSL